MTTAVPQRVFARLTAPYRAGHAGLDRRIRVLVAASFLAVAARMGLVTFLGIFFVTERGLDVTLVGAAFLLENVVLAAVGPFGGALSDRVGRKPVMLGGLIALAAVLPAFILVEGALALLAWSALLGAAQGFHRPAAFAQILDLAPPERRQSALALNYSALALGYTVGVAPAGFIAEQGYGFLAAAGGLGYLAVAAIVAFGLRGPLPREARSGPPASFLADALRAPRDGAFMALAALGAVFPLGLGLATIALPLYAAESGIGEAAIGLVLGASGVLIALLSLPVNARIERSGPLRHLPVSALLVAAAFAVFAAAPTVAGLLVGLTVFTLGEIVFATALPTAVAQLAPPGARGAYQGAWGMIFSIASGAALLVSGLARDAVGWRSAWIGFATLTLVAGAGWALARRRLRAVADARTVAREAEAAP